MSDPVSVTEAALLARDQDAQPWQQAFVVVLSGPLSRAELLARIGERIGYAPRFRRVVSGFPIPGWVDDPGFHLAGHVREATLALGQSLQDWLAESLTALDRGHPLWQATLVGGLAPDTQALVVRCHPALVDGYDNIHLLQELFDETPEPIQITGGVDWQPSESVPPALGDLLAGDPLGVVSGAATGLLGLVENAVRSISATSRRHYVAGAEVDLDAVSAVRQASGCRTHDVLLTLATAGVRGWLAGNARPLSDPVALVPLAITEPAVLASAIGCRIAPSWLGLPVTAATAAQRLEAISTLTRARIDTGLSVPAHDLTELAGFAPPTLHAVAAGTIAAGRPHQVLISDVPGPDSQRYLGRARVRQIYSLTTTTDDQQLSIGITSHRDRVSLAVAAIAPVEDWARDIGAELDALRAELP